VNREERQFLPNLARLRDHEARVFERLTHTAFGRKVARHHFWSLSVHHLRGRRRGPGDIEECGLVEAEPRGKYQTFGQRQAIKPEDQIDRELGAAAIADLSHVEALGEENVQDRGCGLCDLRIAADKADAVTVAHLRARSGNRRFEETKLLFDARAERGQLIRVAGAGADDDFTSRCGQ
jgi:hypothetical protein